MRSDMDTLTRSVEQLNEYYSDHLCSILMLMLQWDSQKRQDFVTLRSLMHNIRSNEPEEAA